MGLKVDISEVIDFSNELRSEIESLIEAMTDIKSAIDHI
ncbi:hypothetical protein SAMN05421736_10898 [Evansella caseinilytica]|uniref:Uncharacterized protein n=1 Tax=Evansella caseinilytica TaxID=1503961 RepID=A0A1H3RI49_9BACI|nr:hypothetical protein SAMN05421736_10898 [Evansella caseinilytica]